jgi:hypothetical protein
MKGFHRKDAKNAEKTEKIAGENRQHADADFVTSSGYPDIERHDPFFFLPGLTLRPCGEKV